MLLAKWCDRHDANFRDDTAPYRVPHTTHATPLSRGRDLGADRTAFASGTSHEEHRRTRQGGAAEPASPSNGPTWPSKEKQTTPTNRDLCASGLCSCSSCYAAQYEKLEIAAYPCGWMSDVAKGFVDRLQTLGACRRYPRPNWLRGLGRGWLPRTQSYRRVRWQRHQDQDWGPTRGRPRLQLHKRVAPDPDDILLSFLESP